MVDQGGNPGLQDPELVLGAAFKIISLVHDHLQPTDARLLYRRLDEIFLATDYDWHMKKPDGRPPSQGKEPRWENRIHWNVFDFAVLEQMMACVGMEVELTALIHPYHMVVLGRKPP